MAAIRNGCLYVDSSRLLRARSRHRRTVRRTDKFDPQAVIYLRDREDRLRLRCGPWRRVDKWADPNASISEWL
jgi:hypothetical protein